MKSFKKVVLHGGAIALAAMSLAGCDSGSNRDNPPNNGGGGTVRQEDQFGMAFATAFRAENNSEPKTVNDGDLVAISLTSEPVTIN